MTDVLEPVCADTGSGSAKRGVVTALRVGVLLDEPTVQAWQYEVIREVTADPSIEITPIWTRRGARAEASPERNGIRGLFWRWLSAAEDGVSFKAFGGIWRRLKMRPEQRVAIADLGLELGVDRAGERRASGLDVIIDFSAEGMSEDTCGTPRFGVLRMYHADRHGGLGGPVGFHEVLDQLPVTKAALRVEDGSGDSTAVVSEGYYTTYLSSWSENRRRLLWASRYLLIDAIKRLAAAPDRPLGRNGITDLRWGRQSEIPTAAEMLAYCVRIPWGVLTRSAGRFMFRLEWRLLVGRGDVQGRPIADFQQIKTPYGRFWADPFVIERDGDVWVFFEDYYYSTRRGVISCFRLTDTGYDSFHEVLSLPFHLSYPFLLERDGKLYMIPESCENRTVDAWECVAFPDEWRKVTTLLDDVSAVDSTLVEHDGRWWMFNSHDRQGLGDHGSEMFIYHADDPIHGHWEEHSANPIIVDPRSARMAGEFLRSASGGLIRCAQVGGPLYGAGTLFFEITTLTPDSYAETLVESIEPLWKDPAVGVHTYNSIPGATVLDVNVRFPRWIRRER